MKSAERRVRELYSLKFREGYPVDRADVVAVIHETERDIYEQVETVLKKLRYEHVPGQCIQEILKLQRGDHSGETSKK